MYPNLRAEMARKRITIKMLADEVGVTTSTMCAKLGTPDRLKVEELKKIQEKFFPESSISYLIQAKKIEV